MMINTHQEEAARPSRKLYQITVRGTLEDDWRDWINGMLISSEDVSDGNSTTTITCKVRDQAEFIGIINWLHNMNLEIEKVCLLPISSDRK